MSDPSPFSTIFAVDPTTAPPPAPPPITAWSYSRWATYEGCPRRAKYQFVDKLPEPESEAIVRGKDIHAAAASILSGKLADCGKEAAAVLAPWMAKLEALKALGPRVEHQAAFTIDWEPTEWFSRRAWLRVVFDVIVPPAKNRSLTIDFKTGKTRAEHEDQLSLYGCAAAALYPDAEEHEVCFVYLDHPHVRPLQRTFKASSLAPMRAMWEQRAGPMLRDTEFPTRVGPGCRWCPYASTKGGPCDKG